MYSEKNKPSSDVWNENRKSNVMNNFLYNKKMEIGRERERERIYKMN